MILAEPRGGRAAFLREVCDRLGLQRIEIYDRKLRPDFPEQVGGVISRAVGPIKETLDCVTSCLAAGGKMIFMKGPGCDHEVDDAVTSRGDLFRLAADHAYVDSRHDPRSAPGRLRAAGKRARAGHARAGGRAGCRSGRGSVRWSRERDHRGDESDVFSAVGTY